MIEVRAAQAIIIHIFGVRSTANRLSTCGVPSKSLSRCASDACCDLVAPYLLAYSIRLQSRGQELWYIFSKASSLVSWCELNERGAHKARLIISIAMPTLSLCDGFCGRQSHHLQADVFSALYFQDIICLRLAEVRILNAAGRFISIPFVPRFLHWMCHLLSTQSGDGLDWLGD